MMRTPRYQCIKEGGNLLTTNPSLSARKTENMHAQASLDCIFSVFLLPEMPVSGSKDDEATNCGVSKRRVCSGRLICEKRVFLLFLTRGRPVYDAFFPQILAYVKKKL